MFKDLRVLYGLGFILMTLFGIYYYQDILFDRIESPPPVEIVTVDRKFNVQGMFCDSCRVKIEKKVKAIPGVVSVDVNVESGEMVVSYEENQENIQQTLSAVKELGYTPGLKSSSGKLQVLDFNVTFQ
ncbi:MAG: heavy-metal-associated domain-containing protein [Candidatus Margulisiibacteriota bacterium]